MGRRSARTKPGPFLLDVTLVPDGVGDPGRYPFDLPAVRHLGTLAFHPQVTFLVGENGAGKSTLLEGVAVACGLNPEGGSPNFRFATRPSHSPLGDCLRLGRPVHRPADSFFLRAETFYNVATEVEQLGVSGYGDRPLHEQSHGESFFALFGNRFRANGLYLLDEPEAALSPRRQIEFLAALHGHCRRGCQLVIASHAPIILAYPDAWIYVLDGAGVRRVPYQETDHYLVTRGFLANPRRTLDTLLADDDSDGRSGTPNDE